MNTRVGLRLATCLLFAWSGSAQIDTPEALGKRMMSAYQSKDYPTFLILARHMLAMTPEDPRALYNVASAEALMQHPKEALQQLDRLLLMHLDFGAEKDPDFTGMRKTPEWVQFEEHLAAMRKPVIRSSVAFTLREKGLFASGVAVDEGQGDSYVGSVRERKVLKRTKDGVVSDFATEKDGLLGVTSLLVDPVRHQLFVGTSAVEFMQDYHKEEEGKAVLLVFDLTSGKLIRSAPLALQGERHVLGQMTEDARGNVFVVDTGASEIRRLRRSSSELELYISSVVFHAPRGLALSKDERTLYVLDRETGLWSVDVLSIDRVHLDTAENVWMGGMAGLLRIENGFASVQLGVKPKRIVRIRLDDKRDKVVSVETLESNLEAYDWPELGTTVGSDLWYLADGQLDLVDPHANGISAAKMKATEVLKMSLAQ